MCHRGHSVLAASTTPAPLEHYVSATGENMSRDDCPRPEHVSAAGVLFCGGSKAGRTDICNDANGPAVSCVFCNMPHGDGVGLLRFA